MLGLRSVRLVSDCQPMNPFNLSLASAESFFSFFSYISVGAAFVAFVSGGVVFYTTLIKEEYSEVRMAKNELEVSAANKIAAEATLLAEQTKQQNLKLQSAVEAEKIKRVELELSILPRHLSDDQKRLISLELSKLVLPIRLKVVTEENQEAKSYAQDFLDAFNNSGKIIGSAESITTIPPHIGLLILTRNFNNPSAVKLKHILDAAKIKSKLLLHADADSELVLIFGVRPVGKL